MFLLIPYTRFTLKSYLGTAAAQNRLAEQVEARKLRFGFPFGSRDHKPFEGTVADGRFKINRIIHYRNSFLPIVVGRFHDELDVTRIEITLRLSYHVMAFLVIFLSFLGATTVGIAGDASGTDGPWVALIFPAVLVFFYVLTIAFFNYEANKARQFLEEVFQVSGSVV